MVVIALRPMSQHGTLILGELEQRTRRQPERLEDGTRRYFLEDDNIGLDAFDAMLDDIYTRWRQHIERP